LPLQHLLGRLDGVGMPKLLELANDERLIELQRDLLGQTALVQPQARTDHDHRAGGIIDPLAEQVLAEAALLALDHVSERLERAIRGAENRPLAAVVVEQGIDRLLQHPLLVADDDFRRVEIDELAQAVIAVDDASIKVVQVARGEIAAVEQHQRPQVRWNYRDHIENHPLRTVLAVADALDDLESIDEVLFLLLGVRLDEVLAEHVGELYEVETNQE